MLSIVNLNDQNGINKYRCFKESMALNDPYFLIDYLEIFSDGLDNAICFFFSSNENGGTIIMPGHLKEIVLDTKSTGLFDFVSPYGYSGPRFSAEITGNDIKNFWTAVDLWYKTNNVITEFIRFDLAGNFDFYSGEVISTMLNIKGNIVDEEDQWQAFDRKVRKNVNRAKKEGLSSEIYYGNVQEHHIKEFYHIYIETMKRTNAKETFNYSFTAFLKFINNNPENVAICTIYLDKIAISTELLLVSSDTIYSFLGGTNDIYFEKRPNDFLKVEALNWARSINKKYYVLGGGYGYEDGIFKYKKAFFPNDVVHFYTGRKIIDQKLYEDLVEKTSIIRVKSGNEKLNLEDKSFFPLYNKTST